ncbi:MAG: hypothetical protein CK425_04255 [Parachlamydia sp.]|nr:MAG: hypothetical protein CK425_04255 [Parachlamydia sp.]
MNIDPRSSSNRIIISYKSNLTPSTQSNNLMQDTIDHAYLRLQLHAMLAVAYHKTALRSSGKPAHVNLKTTRARLQAGRGSGGYHAAHPNTAAGLSDDRRKQIIKEIRQEKVVTPRKKGILRAKGFSERQLKKLLKTNLTTSKFKSLFDSIWPKSALSIIDGTTLNLVANGTTTQLPDQLNWQCDGRLERAIARKNAPTDFKELMQGKCSPETSTKRYCARIQTHLRQSVAELQERIKILKDLKSMFSTFSTSITTDQLTELKRAKLKLSRSAPGAPKAAYLKNFGDFVSALNKNKKCFKSSLKKHGSKTRIELIKQIKFYKKLLSYASNELKGTQMPPFAQLIGEYHAASNSFVPLSPAKVEILQMKLLRPLELDSPPPKLNLSKKGKSKKNKIRKELF